MSIRHSMKVCIRLGQTRHERIQRINFVIRVLIWQARPRHWRLA